MIYWETFSWEAFATLATGLAAVVAAMVIGLRQAKVMTEQTLIQGRQTALAAQNLREALFDRRLEVFAAATRFHAAILDKSLRTAGYEEKFLDAVLRAKFLFSPSIEALLWEVWEAADGYTSKATGDTATFGTDEQKTEVAELRQRFKSLRRRLDDEFAGEMKLSEVA